MPRVAEQGSEGRCLSAEIVSLAAPGSKVIGVIYGEHDGVNMLGEVAFVMSVPHYYTAQARSTGSATILTLTRTVFDKLLAPYPECYETIMGNLLEEYDMDRKGRVVHHEKQSTDAQTLQERREIIDMIQVMRLPASSLLFFNAMHLPRT